MRIVFGILLIALTSATSASAELSQKAVEFLKEIGVDAESDRVRSILNDAIQIHKEKVVSVEELAKNRNKTALLRFISTRNFVQAYVRDMNTRLPATDDYDASFLTLEEKVFVQPAFRRAGDELYLRSIQKQKK